MVEIKEEVKKTLIDEAKEVADRIEKANERHAELLRQEQEMKAQDLLSGRVNQPTPQPTPKLSDKEYALASLSGKVLD